MTPPVPPVTLTASEKGRKLQMTKRWSEMYDISMASEYLGVSEATIRHEVYQTKRIVPIKIGRLLLLTQRMLINWQEKKQTYTAEHPLKPTRIEVENILSFKQAHKYIKDQGVPMSEGRFKQEIREGFIHSHQFGAKYHVYRKIDLDEFVEFRKANPRPKRGRPV